MVWFSSGLLTINHAKPQSRRNVTKQERELFSGLIFYFKFTNVSKEGKGGKKNKKSDKMTLKRNTASSVLLNGWDFSNIMFALSVQSTFHLYCPKHYKVLRKRHYDSWFTSEETEARDPKSLCPWSHSQKMRKPGSEPCSELRPQNPATNHSATPT